MTGLQEGPVRCPSQPSRPCRCRQRRGARLGGKDGTTTFSEFIGQLLAQGRAPAWRFAPSQLRLDPGGTLQAHNRGGEDHTFTEVANFGGGCIEALNGLLGLTPVPECAGFPGGAFGATLVPPGGTVTTSPLPPGIHRYECLIHPWMRTTANVG